MTSLDNYIDHLNLQYKHLLEMPVFYTKWKMLKERLEALIKDIITKKQGKFAKDKLAFFEGYAYKWTGRNLARRGPLSEHSHQGKSITMDPTESDSSLSSSFSQQASSCLTGSKDI